MVMPLGPSKFYGKSLPRPRIYNAMKFSSERVDPPMPVTAPLMSWAKDAPWSMGGLSLKRKRMLGKIQGNLKKLKTLDETKEKIKENENENARSSSDAEIPTHKDEDGPNHCPNERTPSSTKFFRPEWSEQESDTCSLVVPESTGKSVRRPSPRVRIGVRNLDNVFKAAAVTRNGAPSNLRDCPTKTGNVARSALRKEAKRVVGQIYDYVEMPDKVMQFPRKYSTRRSSSEASVIRCSF